MFDVKQVLVKVSFLIRYKS